MRAWLGETELDMGSPQQRAVLAVLLLAEGRQVPLDALVDALWGDDPPLTAVSTVRTYVSRLRRCLRTNSGGLDDVIESAGGGYALSLRSAALDLNEFLQCTKEARAASDAGDADQAAVFLQDALGLWRGVPLAGLPGCYAESQRVRLAELRLAALEERLALDIELGRHATAATELQALLASHPMRERLSELLMLALYRSGRRADALGVFRTTQCLLREELGIDPGPALRDVHQRILRTDQNLIDPAGRGSPGPGALADLPGQQQTRTDTIEWSHSLLPAPPQQLLARPSVSAAPFTTEAAAAVSGQDDVGTMESMSTLLRHNITEHAYATPMQAHMLQVLVRLGATERVEQALAELVEQQRERGEMRIAMATLRLAQEDPQAAIAALAPVLDGSVPLTNRGWLIQAFLVEAIACDTLGDQAAAGCALEHALDLAEPDHAVLVFLLNPAPELLERHARRHTAHAALISEILNLLVKAGTEGSQARSGGTGGPGRVEPPRSWRVPGGRPPGLALREPLTSSETRVLRYLPTNLSAPEIARQLSVSVNTIRTHMRHMYEKLGAHHRADAVERARALGLVAPFS
jgi:DNA-binding SARP family transcriptional activator/DNA-binding CsgD family transcriptional regulator